MAIFSKLGNYKNTGLLLMRVGIGAMMLYVHGYPKLIGGPEKWEKLGSNMKLIGIDFLPLFWGLMAASTEAIGGLLLILGLFFRPAVLLLAFTMVVAALSHFAKGGGLSEASHAIEIGFAFLGMLILGPGKYSIDKQ